MVQLVRWYRLLYLTCFTSTVLLRSGSEASTSTSEDTPLFTNDWLVKIDGGQSVANLVAKKHGFVNRGQINDMNQWYHFVHVTSPLRSKRSEAIKHLKLSSENVVLHVEQQVVKSRVKRETFQLPTDPLWKNQWYLNSINHSSSKTMNIQKVWEQGFTGKGVVVAILDDGLEHSHSDLIENYDPEASYDFNDHDSNPIPRYDNSNENKHGTRCAGVVAAGKNDVCMIGVAYNASIGGVRMLDGDLTDVVEGQSLSFQSQHIAIYSNSWGPDDDGVTVDGPGTLAKHAILDGITLGRNGLGSIYVWASGNGGDNGDSCSCDGYVTSIYTIAIGAVTEHGEKPWYSEECPALLAVTYSSGGVNDRQIITTDLRNSCTRRHTGTSAAAPLAAGIIALALQANPKLTWRDVQHIIVLTSRSQLMKSVHFSNWQVNGAGLDVSHTFGFGLIDSTALVSRARHWQTVPAQVMCNMLYNSHHKRGNIYRVYVNQLNCDIKYLEHVQAVVSIDVVGRRGDVTIHLTSPSGYTSHLLQHRQRDYRSTDFREWPFMTLHHWGEQPNGTWTLRIDSTRSHLSKVHLILYGTSQEPASVSRIPRSCDQSCVGGCAGEGPEFCDDCINLQMASTLACVDECPVGTYKNLHMCRNCPSNCLNCTDNLTCLHCQHNYGITNNGTCHRLCPLQAYYIKLTKSCDLCDASCLDCIGPNSTDCISCFSHHSLEDGRCILNTTCPTGQFFNQIDIECIPCIDNCLICNNSLMCSHCIDGYFLYNEKQYEEDGVCKMCTSQCAHCSTFENCQACYAQYRLSANEDMCHPCCIDGSNGSDCCDCSANATHCVSPSTHASDDSKQQLGATTTIILSLYGSLLLVAIIASIVIVAYFIYRRRTSRRLFHIGATRLYD